MALVSVGVLLDLDHKGQTCAVMRRPDSSLLLCRMGINDWRYSHCGTEAPFLVRWDKCGTKPYFKTLQQLTTIP